MFCLDFVYARKTNGLICNYFDIKHGIGIIRLRGFASFVRNAYRTFTK